MVILRLNINGLTLSDMLHLVWSLPELRSLRLQGDFEKDAHALHGSGVLQRIKKSKPNACRKLRHLELDSVSGESSMSSVSDLLAIFTGRSSH